MSADSLFLLSKEVLLYMRCLLVCAKDVLPLACVSHLPCMHSVVPSPTRQPMLQISAGVP